VQETLSGVGEDEFAEKRGYWGDRMLRGAAGQKTLPRRRTLKVKKKNIQPPTPFTNTNKNLGIEKRKEEK